MFLLLLFVKGRPKRAHKTVERFGYEVPTSSSRRRRSNEVKNLDQYSSNDEYGASQSDRPTRRKKSYDMRARPRRHPQRKTSHHTSRQRDTSSESSSESADEQRFAKRNFLLHFLQGRGVIDLSTLYYTTMWCDSSIPICTYC